MRAALEESADNAVDPPRPTADEVIALYWERAYRFASMVAKGDEDSGDIAQEALTAAIRSLDRFDPAKGSFSTWLWRIVLNTARDAGRASVRRRLLLDRLARQTRTIPLEDPESLAIDRLSDQRLLDAVRALKPRPRTLIALRFGAQLSYSEIAAHIGVSESAVVMATRRALANLRHQLEVS